MSFNLQAIYLVDIHCEPVLLVVRGRANYLNCSSVRQFLERVIKEGRRHIAIDFAHCEGMDSTFLGIIAGAALHLRKYEPRGVLTLCRLSHRNLELVRNLGLHRILQVDSSEFPMYFKRGTPKMLSNNSEERASQKMILQAHENLVFADKDNYRKFQDVLTFLKNQVEEDRNMFL